MARKIADPWYKSAKWIATREAVMRRDRYLCQVSLRYGRRVQATTVHHIFPREEFPELQWTGWNLIAVSGEVHDSLHDRRTGALSRKGVELLRRTARRHGLKVPMRYGG